VKTLIITLLALILSACASWQQAVSGFGAAALVSIRAAEDENIKVWTANACGTPYSAAVRNSQIIPALKVLCTPSVLLDAVK